MNADIEPIVGRYMRVKVGADTHRIYFEEAGQGVPLLCLHTGGADGRQFRHLMNDPEITAKFRVVAFDLPYHGKSFPPDGYHKREYQLTIEAYVGLIQAVRTALGLERPIALGCSIGGRIVLHLAIRCPDEFSALIGLGCAARQTPWYDTSWLHKSDVDGGGVCAGVVSGLMSPQSPEANRWETLWPYLQSAPGVFKGDIYFYREQADLTDQLAGIDARKLPLVLMAGAYDFSCTTEDSARTAAAIPGAELVVMPELGHFPMSENPAAFRRHLMPVLDKLAKARSSS